jgi:hypothetical protein
MSPTLERTSALAATSGVLSAIADIFSNRLGGENSPLATDLCAVAIFVALLVLIAVVDYRRDALVRVTAPAAAAGKADQSLPPGQPLPGPGEAPGLVALSVLKRLVLRSAGPILLGCVLGALVAALTISMMSPAAGIKPPHQAGGLTASSNVVRVSVTPGDGGHKIGNNIMAQVNVEYPPPAGHSYWLIAQFTGNGNTVYKVRDPVPSRIGSYSFPLSISTSAIGSERSLYVVDGNRQAAKLLNQNYDNQAPAWDGNRTELPAGAIDVSNVVRVVKQVA